MAIFLIRHGETDLNARRIIQPAHTPLSERGHQQARRLAERLAGERLGRLLASDLARAEETARALASVSGLELELDPLLQERNLGDLRGRAYADLGFDPFAPDYEPPGGESWEQFFARVERAWRRIVEVADATEGHLAVVTHGLVCSAVATRHAQRARGPEVPPDGPLRFENTSVTIIDARPPWRIELLGCARHLVSEGLSRAGGGIA